MSGCDSHWLVDIWKTLRQRKPWTRIRSFPAARLLKWTDIPQNGTLCVRIVQGVNVLILNFGKTWKENQVNCATRPMEKCITQTLELEWTLYHYLTLSIIYSLHRVKLASACAYDRKKPTKCRMHRGQRPSVNLVWSLAKCGKCLVSQREWSACCTCTKNPTPLKPRVAHCHQQPLMK